MYSAQFIFKPGTYDADFLRLDAVIEEFVQELPGYLGVEKWLSSDGSINNSMYYFADKATLEEFARFPDHLAAKKDYQRWYDGYQVVISEVIAAYGDKKIASIAAAHVGRAAPPAS